MVISVQLTPTVNMQDHSADLKSSLLLCTYVYICTCRIRFGLEVVAFYSIYHPYYMIRTLHVLHKCSFGICIQERMTLKHSSRSKWAKRVLKTGMKNDEASLYSIINN